MSKYQRELNEARIKATFHSMGMRACTLCGEYHGDKSDLCAACAELVYTPKQKKIGRRYER